MIQIPFLDFFINLLLVFLGHLEFALFLFLFPFFGGRAGGMGIIQNVHQVWAT